MSTQEKLYPFIHSLFLYLVLSFVFSLSCCWVINVSPCLQRLKLKPGRGSCGQWNTFTLPLCSIKPEACRPLCEDREAAARVKTSGSCTANKVEATTNSISSKEPADTPKRVVPVDGCTSSSCTQSSTDPSTQLLGFHSTGSGQRLSHAHTHTATRVPVHRVWPKAISHTQLRLAPLWDRGDNSEWGIISRIINSYDRKSTLTGRPSRRSWPAFLWSLKTDDPDTE